MALGGGDVHRPVAGAGDVRLPPALEGLHRADLVAKLLRRAIARLNELAEHIVEPFVLEVALLLRDPLLQAEVRLDDEFSLAIVPPLVSSAAVEFFRRPGHPRTPFVPAQREPRGRLINSLLWVPAFAGTNGREP